MTLEGREEEISEEEKGGKGDGGRVWSGVREKDQCVEGKVGWVRRSDGGKVGKYLAIEVERGRSFGGREERDDGRKVEEGIGKGGRER